MFFEYALRHLRHLLSSTSHLPLRINFITPIEAAILAAYKLRNPSFLTPVFNEKCLSYAIHCGLLQALQGTLPAQAMRSGLQGRTYSRLTKLYYPEHVDGCNQVVGELLQHWLLPKCGKRMINEIDYVIGELHDNVVSHSNGAGFSAAQYYDTNDAQRLVVAVVDAGVGLLKNVGHLQPQITTHSSAIEWCLQKGHTTARETGEFGQRLTSEDAYSWANPYSEDIEIRKREVHHKGDGLWYLCNLIKETDSNLWIWSGNACYKYLGKQSGNQEGIFPTDCFWNGVAIEVEFIIRPGQKLPESIKGDAFDDLAGRYGL